MIKPVTMIGPQVPFKGTYLEYSNGKEGNVKKLSPQEDVVELNKLIKLFNNADKVTSTMPDGSDDKLIFTLKQKDGTTKKLTWVKKLKVGFDMIVDDLKNSKYKYSLDLKEIEANENLLAEPFSNLVRTMYNIIIGG